MFVIAVGVQHSRTLSTSRRVVHFCALALSAIEEITIEPVILIVHFPFLGSSPELSLGAVLNEPKMNAFEIIGVPGKKRHFQERRS